MELMKKIMMIDKRNPNQLKFCQKCHKILPESHFYSFKNGEKDVICKECLTMNFYQDNKEKVEELCKRYNIPIIYKEIYPRILRLGLKNKIFTFGRYLAIMKLCSFKNYTYKDSERLNKEYTIDWV